MGSVDQYTTSDTHRNVVVERLIKNYFGTKPFHNGIMSRADADQMSHI